MHRIHPPSELARVRDKQINGFIMIPRDALDGGVIVYRGDNGASPIVPYRSPSALSQFS